MAILTENLTLEELLKLPNLEDSPAWKYIAGKAVQKTMPKFRHSILQKRLLAKISDPNDQYHAHRPYGTLK